MVSTVRILFMLTFNFKLWKAVFNPFTSLYMFHAFSAINSFIYKQFCIQLPISLVCTQLYTNFTNPCFHHHNSTHKQIEDTVTSHIHTCLAPSWSYFHSLKHLTPNKKWYLYTWHLHFLIFPLLQHLNTGAFIYLLYYKIFINQHFYITATFI